MQKIIFIGTSSSLIKTLGSENETEVLSSENFLSTLALRFEPDLIVLGSVESDIAAIRKIETLLYTPLLIAPEGIIKEKSLSIIEDFNNVILCNESTCHERGFRQRLEGIMSHKSPILPARQGSFVKETILYMNHHISEKIDRTSLCSFLGLDIDYMSRIFKKEIGIGISEYLTSLRLEEAKRLLSLTGISVKDIAIQLGYSNPMYFIHCFKKRFGTPPGKKRIEDLSGKR